MTATAIPRLELWNVIKHIAHDSDERSQALCSYLLDYFKVKDPPESWLGETKRAVKGFLYKFNAKWQSVYRHAPAFENLEWLKTGVETFVSPEPKPCSTRGAKAGRPQGQFKDLTDQSKRRKTRGTRDAHGEDELGYATHMKLREAGRRKAAAVVQKAIEASPRTVDILYAFINVPRTVSEGVSDQKPIAFTLPEALAHKIQCKMTKNQYILNRDNLSAHNCKVFPSYDRLNEYKRLCYPSNIKVTEKKAVVGLQSLLDHTAERLVIVQRDVLVSEGVKNVTKIELVSKIGFDGSSGHSQYNQKWEGEEGNENTMLLTAVCPLIMHYMDEKGKDTVVWLNQRACSTVHCRPVELEYAKETTEIVRKKVKALNEDIKNLEVSIITVEQGRVIEVSHRVLPTMYDGKIASIATSTAAQNCNVCKATPKQMNDIDSLLKRPCDISAYMYGLPVLHANLRFLDYMLNLVECRSVMKAYCKTTQEERDIKKKTRADVISRIWRELSIRLDKPSPIPGSGNTNTGNNARRFFDHPVEIAEITGLDLDVLKRIKIILRTLSSGYALDIAAFHQYSVATARMLASLYKFYYMPSSVHQLLIHGAAHMESLPVPIGLLSEEALESVHKELRYLRAHHSRTTSRKDGLNDIFKGLLVSSDPLIASLRKKPKPKGNLDPDIIPLLLAPGTTAQAPTMTSLVESDDEEDEEDVDDRGLLL